MKKKSQFGSGSLRKPNSLGLVLHEGLLEGGSMWQAHMVESAQVVRRELGG